MGKTLSRSLVLFCLFLSLFIAWFGYFAFTPLKRGAPDVIVEIRRSDSHTAILKSLLAAGVIDRPEQLNWVGRLTRRWRKVKAGEYRLSASMSPMRIFSVITSGISVPHPITVREGENIYEIAEDLAAKGLAPREAFLNLCMNRELIAHLGFDPTTQSLEGFLFPDTYYFNKNMTTEEMIRQMVHHANQMWTKEDQSQAAHLGMTRYQVITLASIIEKETGAPSERSIISSVFHNRLRKHMRLQSDPTTIYGMWDQYKGNIHKSDLQRMNPYNTYSVDGLPAGPIANPGRDAIEAALHPATSDFLFFVSHNDGTHEFSRSLAEHNQAVRKFQLDPKAREGKSWRNLSKKTHPAAGIGQSSGSGLPKDTQIR